MRPVAGFIAFFVFAALTTDAALAEKMDKQRRLFSSALPGSGGSRIR